MGEGIGYQECFLFCPYEKQFKMQKEIVRFLKNFSVKSPFFPVDIVAPIGYID